MGIFKEKPKCPHCGSEKIRINTQRTVYCNGCHYGFTKANNVFRVYGHPQIDELGWRIKEKHPDFKIFQTKKYKAAKKKNTLMVRKIQVSTWVRNQ